MQEARPIYLQIADKDYTRFSLFVIITDSARFDIKILHSSVIFQSD